MRDYDDLPVEGLQIRNLGTLVGIEYTNNLLLHGNQAIKRALDLVLAGIALIVAAPIIVAAAALVRLSMAAGLLHPGSSRSRGRRIAVPKIRTMRRDAESRLEEHLAASPGLRAEWNARYKLRNDPRLIPASGDCSGASASTNCPSCGVCCGDMSLVGPRPFPDYHIRHFSPAFIELRRSRATGNYRPVAGHRAQRRQHRRTGKLRQLLHPQLVGVARFCMF